MHIISQRDFETKAGQEKIIIAIHTLERKVHELEKKAQTLNQAELSLERNLQGPEAY